MDEVNGNHDMKVKRVEEEKPMEEKSKSEGRESTAVAIQANVFDEEASFVERIQRISTHAELDDFLTNVEAETLQTFRLDSEEPPFLHFLVDNLPKRDNIPVRYLQPSDFTDSRRWQLLQGLQVENMINHEIREKYWEENVSVVLEKHKDKLQPILDAKRRHTYQRGDVIGCMYQNAVTYACAHQDYRIAKELLKLGVPFQEEALAYMSEMSGDVVQHDRENNRYSSTFIDFVTVLYTIWRFDIYT